MAICNAKETFFANLIFKQKQEIQAFYQQIALKKIIINDT
jgi:hypothetical protein